MNSIQLFNTQPFINALKALFKDLKVPMNYVADEPTTAKEILKDTYKENDSFQLIDDVYFVGMVDDAAFDGNKSLEADKIKSDYDGILIFGVTLKNRANGLLPTRSQLAEISRAFNREFYYTPVVVVFKYGNYLAFANTERLKYKQEWREGEKAGKVSLLRDIHIEKPHSGHERILAELQIPTTGTKKVDSFAKLYTYWQEVFSVNLLNKKFYQELSNWYFWATKHVAFPGEPIITDAHHKNTKLEDLLQAHRATNVIRMLTRLLFVWFIKEKKLIPEELFELDTLQKDILNEISPYHDNGLFSERNKDSIYYKAILQNLFFATLNCPIEGDSLDKRKRGFRGDGYGTHRGIDYLMRYKQYFKNPDAFLEKLNAVVPFLNGGLFECLDDKFNNIYIDGFSDQMTKGEQLVVPDYLFFGVEEETDLSDIVGIKDNKYKQAAVKGLINILKSYKFTITENTPIEEDVALDPELLGKVFENLLASYNPETKTTARKQTGSFYTPREIVNYMVDESLIAYLKNKLSSLQGEQLLDDETLDKELHVLTSFDSKVPFTDNPELQREIISALSSCTILDPACGSGAFPMGILQKMVHILQKLDPKNKIWKEVQLEKARKESEAAFEIEDKQAREERLLEINEAFDQSINDSDYARKLFLIENCIYGVDIQPIATQISKLRFFISLVVEQKVNAEKDNFGIRPLPNLETKFVAANTLIGIEKDSGLFETDEVKNLENELKIVRHKIFSLKSKERKIAWREKDKELREKLSKALKNQGLPLDAAEKLAGWDPYDQNASSPFFDAEWMFGIKEGFDIVIGNPPYKVESKADQIKYKGYSTINCGDLYAYFYEKSLKSLLKQNGALSFITASLFIKGLKFDSLRLFLEQNLKLIALEVQGDKVFDNVQMPTAVLIGTKSNNKTNNWSFENYIPNNNLIKSLEANSKPLSQICDVMRGFEIGRDQLNDSGEVKFITGSDVQKWRIKRVSYISKRTESEYKKNEDYFMGERILIRETGSDLTVLYLKTKLYCNRSLYSIKVRDKKYSPKYLAALLNSSIFQFYYQSKFKSETDLFPKIRITQVNKLPIRNSENQSSFDKIVDYVLLQKKENFDSSFFERLIDAMVYELYLPEEIKAGAAEALKHLGNLPELKEGQDENLSAVQAGNLKTIEKVYKELSHPKHPVSVAMQKLLTIEEVNIIEGRN